jgi:hypothetical protein
MCRKFVFLLSFVLVFSLAGSTFGATIYNYQWRNDSNSGLWNQAGGPPYQWARSPSWQNPDVWTLTGVPPEALLAGDTSLDIWLTGSTHTRLTDVNIPAGYDANCAAKADGFQRVVGPDWGLHLDIHGKLGIRWCVAPMQGWAGLLDTANDPNDLVPPDDPNRSVVNMFDGSELYGPWLTGNTLGGHRCEVICIGLSWWSALPYVSWNMYGNSVVYADALILGGHLNMYGGTFDVLDYVQVGQRDLFVVPDNLIRIDIYEGKLILPGSVTPLTVEDWINRGILIAYGGEGTIVIDPNINPGRTTVTAISGIGLTASLPKPPNGATGVPRDVVLKWRPGQYADTHDVYFGTDETKVTDANKTNQLGVLVSEEQEANTYDPCGLLELNTTYYWRIDEVNDACAPGLWKGNVWSFTTLPYNSVDDFESYADDDALRDVWIGGGRAQISLQPGKNDANLVRDGNSMMYYYDNYFGPYYAEAYADTATLPSGIGSNWTVGGVKALVLWFYGTADNDANEQMYVKLTDGNIPAHSKTVMYDGAMSNIRKEEWQQWNIPLSDFTNVNLANVARITIRFGDGVEPVGQGTGTMYFEDIRLYQPWCRPELVATDFTGDCKVDVNDLQRMAEIWLGQMPTPPTPPQTVINLDASGLALGALSTWNNAGSASGSFKDFNSVNPADNPTVAMVDGVKAVVFDGNDLLVATFRAPPSITGNNPFTAIYKVRNPEIGVEEWVLQWAKRGTTARYAAVGYGTSPGWGVAAHWAAPDMGFDRGVPADHTWHTIAVTYPGGPNSVETVLVDGVVNATEIKTLNIFPDCNLTVGAAYDGNSTNDPNFVLAPIYYLSGAVASVKVYSVAIPPDDLAILMGSKIDLKKDDVIDFKDYAVLANDWLKEQLWP